MGNGKRVLSLTLVPSVQEKENGQHCGHEEQHVNVCAGCGGRPSGGRVHVDDLVGAVQYDTSIGLARVVASFEKAFVSQSVQNKGWIRVATEH